jgi:hypothetical protein
MSAKAFAGTVIGHNEDAQPPLSVQKYKVL